MNSITSTTFLNILLLTTCVALLAHYAIAMDPSLSSDTFLDSLGEKHNNNENLKPEKRLAFYVGSRYGRSGNSLVNKPRRVKVAQRNDRFFLGSRYGKRSGEFAAPVIYEQDTADLVDEDNNGNTSRSINFMSCVYTGVKNLYRCTNTNFNDLNTLLTPTDDLETHQLQQ